ncbi:MAG TPA: pimeloyl-ACP methyl ester esterase BioH [Gammaproteobacteria bacterium]
MSGLHIEVRGTGPDLVLLHGWGLHGGLFRSLADRLAPHFRLHLVDLPGHGRSVMPEGDYTLASIAAYIAAHVPAHAAWLGWSLGGRVALMAAINGAAISRLILIGANPAFIQRDDWPHGMPAAELQQFADALRDDYKSTLQRFLAVQSRGSERAREELRALRDELFAHGEPHPEALAGGLEILRGADLREHLAAIQQPVLVIHGERDTLAPIAAAEFTARSLPHGRLLAIPGAGHAPFISHPDQVVAALLEFLA